MNRPIEIGITGGIGSGKSLVSRIFHSLGVPVYDADTQARELMSTDKTLAEQIRQEFGSSAYSSTGELNRPYLARTVFGNPEQLQKLNSMVHPAVGKDYDRWVVLQVTPYVIREAALIFEAGISKNLKAVIVVSAPEALRVRRVIHRDPQRTEMDVMKIIHSQMPEEEKLKLASYVIRNDESQLVIPQVIKLHEHFLTLT